MNLAIARAAFYDELQKIADVQTELLPHQQRVVNKIQRADQPGLVVAHGLGSGKTLTSIAAQDALGMPSSVVVPAALQANYKKEREKHLTGDTPDATISTMQNAAVKGKAPSAPFMIVDEAHRARDPSSKTYKALANTKSEKRLLLTGSPFYNHPSDIAPLVNLAAGDKILPPGKEEFSERFITPKNVNPGLFDRFRGVKPGVVDELNSKRAPELRDTFSKWVDYHPGSTEGFPQINREDIPVEMTPQQLHVYDTMMSKAPAWVAAKVRAGLPPSKQESQQLNAFLSAARQVSNTTAGFQSADDEAHAPKIQAAYKNLKTLLDNDPEAKAVVYSNYLESGINPYRELLKKDQVPFGEFTGEMPQKQRADLVNQYNEGKLRTLLLSSAGGEGLDLKGTRLMQLLEPHWNLEKLKQVEGRGARYQSHAGLAPEKQNLKIERYLSTRPRRGLAQLLHLQDPGHSSDQYLAQLAGDKEKLIEQFRGLLPRGDATPPST